MNLQENIQRIKEVMGIINEDRYKGYKRFLKDNVFTNFPDYVINDMFRESGDLDYRKVKGMTNERLQEIITESLRDWFKKEDWVRIDTAGNITGPCGTMKPGKATTRCLPKAKALSLTKAERAATSRKKVAGSKKGKQFVKNTPKAKVRLNK